MASTAGIEQIKKDEGLRLKSYQDTPNNKAIGYGFNLGRSDANELLIMAGIASDKIKGVIDGTVAITEEQAEKLFEFNLMEAEASVKRVFKDAQNLPQEVKDVFINMSYNLGGEGFSEFTKMAAAAREGNWPEVKKEMLDSKWAGDVKGRAKRLANQVGSLPYEAPEVQEDNRSAEERYNDEVLQARANELISVASESMMVDDLVSRFLNSNQQPEATAVASSEQEGN